MTNNDQIEIELKKCRKFKHYINSLNLSVRATNIILHNCFSFDDLTSLDADSLQTFQNCGRKTVREILNFLDTIREVDDVQVPLSIKERLGAPPTEASMELFPLFSSRCIEDIGVQDLHPDFHASIKLTDIVLSVRTANVLNSLGLKTLGEVMLISANELLGQQNFGRKSLNELKEVIRSFCFAKCSVPGSLAEGSNAIDYSSYETMLSSFLQESEKNQRNQKLFYKRFCFQEGKVPTLEELGHAFDITRERARQILKKGTANFQIKAVLDKLFLFWQTLDNIIIQGGGIIHLGALPSLLQTEFNWPTAPYPLALGQLLLLRTPGQSFKKNSDLIKLDCNCQDCEQPLQKLQSLNFDDNEEFHIQVVALKISKHCRQTCPWKKPVVTFHRAFIEHLVNQCDGLAMHGDIVLPQDKWSLKYCNNLEDVTCHILEEKGEPMHFKKIAAAIRQNNANFSDISDHNVHAAIMRYTDNIEIINRGTYGLKNWGLGGYRSISKAIEAVIDNYGLPVRARFISEKLGAEFPEQHIYTALTSWKNRFQAIGGGFYDRPKNWQNRSCTQLIQLLPESVAQFARYLVSRNNTSYKLVMAFIFIRSMDEYGSIYLSNLKQMFYNFYLSRHKKGLVVEADAALMNRIGELSANEIKNKSSSKPLISFSNSGFFNNFSLDGGKIALIDDLTRQLGNPLKKDLFLITILKAIDDYFQKITPTVVHSTPKADAPQKIAEPKNIFHETSTPTLQIKKKGRGKIKL